MKQDSNSQTAYKHNAHPSSSISEVNNHGWSDSINRMIDQRYAFLALQYENDGYLFRGMSSGLFDALLANKFWHYSSEDGGTNFEKELDVLLVSQDFSDALTVSKLWEQKPDACIIVFRSEIFNYALENKKAAMMATAEPGVVFKYPFLTEPLNLADIDYLIVTPHLLDTIDSNNKLSAIISELHVAGRLIIPAYFEGIDHRAKLEKTLLTTLSKFSVAGSNVINSSFKPKRIS